MNMLKAIGWIVLYALRHLLVVLVLLTAFAVLVWFIMTGWGLLLLVVVALAYSGWDEYRKSSHYQKRNSP